MNSTKELMTGDLVYTRTLNTKHTIRITAIDATTNFVRGIYLNKNQDTGWFSAEIAYPFNLTEQVLDANGLYNNGHDQYRFRIRPHGTNYIDTVEHILNRTNLCTYIHEFQHLLRLCNLHDLADNFKLK